MTTKASPKAWSPAAGFLAVIVVYFALQTLLRLAYASSVGLDEGEILITAQSGGWGHGSQPPLYNWLQIAAFQLFGTDIFALAALKNLLIAGSFVCVFLTGRLVFEDDRKAVVGALAMFLVPQFAWESQRALTHSVIAVAMAALTLLVLVRVLRNGRVLDYALLGLCLGLGSMSKYNYVISAFAMILAATSVRELRPRILSVWMVLALGIAALVFLPHALWLIEHLDLALSRTGKFKAESGAAFSLRPLLAFASAAIQACAVPLLIIGGFAGMAWFGSRKARPSPTLRPALHRFILRIIPIALALTAAGVFAAGATDLRERWLITFTFLLPLALLVLTDDLLSVRAQETLQKLALSCALIAMIALAVVHLFPDSDRDPPAANRPLPAIANDIRKMGFSHGTIIASNTTLAGAFKLEFPDSLVVEPQYGVLAPPDNAPVLMVWQRGGDAPTPPIAELYRQICGTDLAEVPSVLLTALHQHSSVPWSVHAARADCRRP